MWNAYIHINLEKCSRESTPVDRYSCMFSELDRKLWYVWLSEWWKYRHILELVHPGQYDSTGDTKVFQDWFKQKDESWVNLKIDGWALIKLLQRIRVLSVEESGWMFKSNLPVNPSLDLPEDNSTLLNKPSG